LKLDQVSFRSIKNHNELVILIYVSLAETGFLLTGHRFLQPSFRFVREWPFERIGGVELESLGHTRPSEAIVAKNTALS